MKTIKFLLFYFLLLSFSSRGQIFDSIKHTYFKQITVESIKNKNDLLRLEPISGVSIFSGKKNEVILLNSIDANITERTARQVFAKVPGVFVYDMEGGNQLNIATRGLDPHRGWEFNQRKDGAISNSDLYAYPASHYSIPLESVERIEIVRGTASLQYGSQLGGMLNYVTKQADSTKKIGFESFNTIGSYNLISSYNAISGTIKKIKYYVYYAKRTRDGYRENEHTDYDAQGVKLLYEPSKKLSYLFDWVRSSYVYKVPGPLTDVQFEDNPRQSTRFRNYFSPTIQIPSFTFKWQIAKNLKLQLLSSAVVGQRNSVLFDKPASFNDTINTNTMDYNNRQVDIDRFNSFTQELKFLQKYKLGSFENTLIFGGQLITNQLHRTQLGKGTTGTDYNLTLVDPIWGRDLHFRTKNLSFFAEHSWNFTKKLAVNIGLRYELGESKMDGTIVYYSENQIPVLIERKFPLLGASFEYRLIKNTSFYGGFSQSYRSMLFKDLVPSSTFEKVDPSIKDADGYNLELGFRGDYKFMKWDVTGFVLQYNNRFGTLALNDSLGNFYTYRTNIGNSTTKGLEIFIQGNWKLFKNSNLILFTSTSLMDGKYTSGSLRSGSQNVSLVGKKIESVPNIIAINGLTFQIAGWSFTFLMSHTGASFADPLNTEIPNANGTVGLVPAYTLFDFNSSFKFTKTVEFKMSLNNITDKQYFTKRPSFYPGPGVWSTDGRSLTTSVIFRL